MTTIHHTPISLQPDDEDIALSNFMTKSFQPQEAWIQSKQPYVSHNNNNNNNYYKQQRRTRTPPVQLQKSTSTPTNSRSRNVRNQQNDRRRSNLNNTLVSQERRPSFASSVASSSVESDISTASKVSFSNKLRKVFSMSNIRSSKDLSESVVSLPSPVPTEKKSLRRRSIASLSSLFQKTSIQEEEEEKKKPELKVDVKQRKKGHNYNHNVTPDSPNSTISSRSFHPLPPPVNTNTRFTEALPSPTPSSSSSSHRPDELKRPNIGLQYGIGLHASPKLRPAASSSSSSLIYQNDKRRIQFNSKVQVHETWSAQDYDRRCDLNATCQKLTPVVAMKIKQELNEFKLSDMDVHVDSRQYTHFFL
ncbi:unnamed protein product [Rhizopus stolonifer]